jgi:hypothetical protein
MLKNHEVGCTQLISKQKVKIGNLADNDVANKKGYES